MSKRLLLALPSLVLAATLTACGGEEGDEAISPSPSDSSSAASVPGGSSPTEPATSLAPDLPTPTTPGGITTAPAPEPSGPPDAEVSTLWESELAALIDASVTPAERAERIEGGDDLVASLRQVDEALAGYGAEFDVTRTQLAGNTGLADVALTSGGESFGTVSDVGFVVVGDGWRLTRAGACTLAAVAQVECP